MRPCRDQEVKDRSQKKGGCCFFSSQLTNISRCLEDSGDSIYEWWSMMILDVWLLHCWHVATISSLQNQRMSPQTSQASPRSLGASCRGGIPWGSLVADPNGFPIFSNKNFYDFLLLNILWYFTHLNTPKWVPWEGYLIAISHAIQHIQSFVGIWDLW